MDKKQVKALKYGDIVGFYGEPVAWVIVKIEHFRRSTFFSLKSLDDGSYTMANDYSMEQYAEKIDKNSEFMRIYRILHGSKNY